MGRRTYADKRTGKLRIAKPYWAEYFANGKQSQEPLGTSNKASAIRAAYALAERPERGESRVRDSLALALSSWNCFLRMRSTGRCLRWLLWTIRAFVSANWHNFVGKMSTWNVMWSISVAEEATARQRTSKIGSFPFTWLNCALSYSPLSTYKHPQKANGGGGIRTSPFSHPLKNKDLGHNSFCLNGSSATKRFGSHTIPIRFVIPRIGQ